MDPDGGPAHDRPGRSHGRRPGGGDHDQSAALSDPTGPAGQHARDDVGRAFSPGPGRASIRGIREQSVERFVGRAELDLPGVPFGQTGGDGPEMGEIADRSTDHFGIPIDPVHVGSQQRRLRQERARSEERIDDPVPGSHARQVRGRPSEARRERDGPLEREQRHASRRRTAAVDGGDLSEEDLSALGIGGDPVTTHGVVEVDRSAGRAIRATGGEHRSIRPPRRSAQAPERGRFPRGGLGRDRGFEIDSFAHADQASASEREAFGEPK